MVYPQKNPDSAKDVGTRRLGGLAMLSSGAYLSRLGLWWAVIKSAVPTATPTAATGEADAAMVARIATHASGDAFGLADSDPAGKEPTVAIAAKDYTGTPVAAPARINTLADGLANDKHLLAGIFGHLFNGTTWDRQRGNSEGTVLALAARTTLQTVDMVNHNARGVIIYLHATAFTATPILTLRVRAKDPVGLGYYDLLVSAAIAVTAVPGLQATLIVCPGVTPVANLIADKPVPRSWNVAVDVADADSCTYSVSYALIL